MALYTFTTAADHYIGIGIKLTNPRVTSDTSYNFSVAIYGVAGDSTSQLFQTTTPGTFTVKGVSPAPSIATTSAGMMQQVVASACFEEAAGALVFKVTNIGVAANENFTVDIDMDDLYLVSTATTAGTLMLECYLSDGTNSVPAKACIWTDGTKLITITIPKQMQLAINTEYTITVKIINNEEVDPTLNSWALPTETATIYAATESYAFGGTGFSVSVKDATPTEVAVGKFIVAENPCALESFTIVPLHTDINEYNVFEITF